MHWLGRVVLSLLCVALGAVAAQARAACPNKSIGVLMPYAPGGLTDVVARHHAEHMRKTLGQNVVVENKPGASGHRRHRGMITPADKSSDDARAWLKGQTETWRRDIAGARIKVDE